jgi:hypothetical protein
MNFHPYAAIANEVGKESTSSEGEPEERRRVDGKQYVEKGSLTEEALIKAKLQVQKRGSKTEQDKKEERRVANRLSAFQSRIRRKAIIEGLLVTVAEISKENKGQKQSLEDMSAKLTSVMDENAHLRRQLAAATRRGMAVNANLQTNPSVGTGAYPVQGHSRLLLNGGVNMTSHETIRMLNELERIERLKAFLLQRSSSHTREQPGLDGTIASSYHRTR